MPISDYVIGHIRTYVPFVISFLIVWLTDNLGIEVDADTEIMLTSALTTLVGAIYYGLVRLVAKWVPAAGILLGVNKKPAYFEPPKNPA